jgi:hypothetical protein
MGTFLFVLGLAALFSSCQTNQILENTLEIDMRGYSRPEVYHAVLTAFATERIPVLRSDPQGMGQVESVWVRLNAVTDPVSRRNDPTMEQHDIFLNVPQIKYYISITGAVCHIRGVTKSGDPGRASLDFVNGDFIELEIRRNSPEWAKLESLGQTINLMIRKIGP